MKFFVSTLLMFLTIASLSGCSTTAIVGAQLENCDTFASHQEKIDCRLRNKKALDEYDKNNRRDPMSKPRTTRSI